MTKTELHLRQQELKAQSTHLREKIQVESLILVKPLRLIDQCLQGLRWLTEHPVWPASALLAIAVLRPKRTLVWGTRIWRVWKRVRSIRHWLSLRPFI